MVTSHCDTDPLSCLTTAWNCLDGTPSPIPEGSTGWTHAGVNVLLDQCPLDDDQSWETSTRSGLRDVASAARLPRSGSAIPFRSLTGDEIETQSTSVYLALQYNTIQKKNLISNQEKRVTIEQQMVNQIRSVKDNFERNTMTKLKNTDDGEKMNSFEYLVTVADNDSLNYRGQSSRARQKRGRSQRAYQPEF